MHSRGSEWPERVAVQRWGVALLMLNAVGAISYVVLASRGWATQGIPVAGEPFVWAISVMPVCAVFLVLNPIWGAFILARKQWRTGVIWLGIIPIWLVAVGIDFAHH